MNIEAKCFVFKMFFLGKGKLASVPSGGSTASVAATGSVEAPVAKVEEKKEESEEESDDDMGFGLFD